MPHFNGKYVRKFLAKNSIEFSQAILGKYYCYIFVKYVCKCVCEFFIKAKVRANENYIKMLTIAMATANLGWQDKQIKKYLSEIPIMQCRT